MKVYEISEEKIRRGAIGSGSKAALHLGGGSNGKDVEFFRKNPAEITKGSGLPWVGLIMEAHPVPIKDGYALAKPNHDIDQILVVVRGRVGYTREGCSRRTGIWNFDCGTLPWNGTRDKVLMRATGPEDWFARQDQYNVGWHDALVVLDVGDVITVGDENGTTTRAIYKSVEAGLVQIS